MSKLALVGASHIHTSGFIKRIKDRSEVAVKYVWDRVPDIAVRKAVELGAKTVSDPAQIWADDEVKAVVICSETNLHRDLVLAAADAGKDMFVEKPLGIAARDAFEMAEAIKKAGVKFQTGYFNRGNPIYQFLRAQIAAGSFGKLTRIRHSNCHGGGMADWFINKDCSWMTDVTQAGFGGFGDLGSHSLDLLLWLVNRPAARVAASIHTANARFGEQCDEFGDGLIEFEGGLVGSVTASWVDIANPVTCLVSGMEGHAYVADGKLYFKSQHVPGADGAAPWTDLPPAWPHAFELFLDAVTGKPYPALVSAQEAAYSSAVMAAFYQAARTQTWVAPMSS
jgi:predicted dehydrogenase